MRPRLRPNGYVMQSACSCVLLVGSIAGNKADEVFRNCCSAIGNFLAIIPDGETGYRSKYISHLAHTVYARHPDVVTVSRPPPVGPDNPRERRKPGEDWIPMATDASDLWKFGLRKGVRTLRFETLGYAEAAIESYKAFCSVREQGIIPAGVRFQVSLPAAVDCMGFFVDRFADMRYFIPAYENAMAADIRRMLVEGTKTRIEVAKKYKTAFGISTECGFGRRLPETIPQLLEVHKQAAGLL